MKECTICHITKPLDDFYRVSVSRSHHGDGHDTRCKDCVKARLKTPEQRAKTQAAWKKRYATPEGREKERQKCERYRQTEHGKAGHKTRNQKYRQTEKGRDAQRINCAKFRQTDNFKQAIDRYRSKFPEKRAANIAVMVAIRTGELVRPIYCSVCGINCIPHGHHPDYSKPLEVIWLCHKCHTDFHWGRTTP